MDDINICVLLLRIKLEMSTESPELKTVDAHSQELTTAISSDPMCVAGALVDKKFIQDGVMLEMCSKGDTHTIKGTILVGAVRKEIEAAPEKLTQFLEILSEQNCAKEVVESLRSTYQCELLISRLSYDSPVQLNSTLKVSFDKYTRS